MTPVVLWPIDDGDKPISVGKELATAVPKTKSSNVTKSPEDCPSVILTSSTSLKSELNVNVPLPVVPCVCIATCVELLKPVTVIGLAKSPLRNKNFENQMVNYHML